MARKKELAGPLEVSRADTILAYKSVFATQDGQIVLADLMRHFGYTNHSTFSEGGDVNQTLVREGQRTVLIHIGRRINSDPAINEEIDDAQL